MLSNNDPTASSGIPEPITPKKAIGLPTESTPTQYKQSTALPFTSGHVMRDETLVALGNEMVGYVVGPMPAVQFLEFLPRSTKVMPSFDKKPLAILVEAKSESQMYNPFIEAMKDFCPNLTGINTSNTQMTTFSGKTIKPDITYFKKLPDVKGKAPVVNSSDVGGAELMIEVKFSQSDDPFKDVPTAEGFLSDSDRPRQTLGQVTSYATAHLAAQFRTHVFSILLFRRSARLMRWDRAGVIVSQRISLDSPALALFFWRFNSADASARGHDTTVTPFIFTETLTKKFLYDQLLFADDPGEVKVEDVKFLEVLLPRENKRYVIGKATYLGLASLASRATRTYKAWCLTTKKSVFLKDTWRILSRSLRPEHEINKKLAAAKVPYIATVLDHSDLEGHRTITGNYAQKSWACKINVKEFRTLQHYRLVIQEIGRSLTSFKNFPEVLTAMRCALQAHRESYYNGNVLHRDISAGNILIYKNGGLLIDWDMSKDFDLESDKEKKEKNILRSGTWAFQSLRLSKRPKKDEPQLVNGRLDDLESFYHVLFWVSLQHARHGLGPVDLYDDLTRLFDHALIDGDKAYSNRSKDSHMTSTRTINTVNFQNPPLLNLLLKLSVAFKVLYIDPPNSNVIYPPNKMAQLAGESYEKELEDYNEQLTFLNSDKDSNWMEKYFETAIKFPADKWGPNEYMLHEITPPQYANTKRKYTDMTSSNLSVRHNQGGTFLPSYQSAEADEDQDATMDEREDFEDYYEEDGGGNDEENVSQPSSSRRRYN